MQKLCRLGQYIGRAVINDIKTYLYLNLMLISDLEWICSKLVKSPSPDGLFSEWNCELWKWIESIQYRKRGAWKRVPLVRGYCWAGSLLGSLLDAQAGSSRQAGSHHDYQGKEVISLGVGSVFFLAEALVSPYPFKIQSTLLYFSFDPKPSWTPPHLRQSILRYLSVPLCSWSQLPDCE